MSLCKVEHCLLIIRHRGDHAVVKRFSQAVDEDIDDILGYLRLRIVKKVLPTGSEGVHTRWQ